MTQRTEQETTRLPGVGAWLGWVVATLVGPLLGAFTAQMASQDNIGLSCVLLITLLAAQVVPQWLVLHVYISELSLGAWIWALVLALILLAVLAVVAIGGLVAVQSGGFANLPKTPAEASTFMAALRDLPFYGLINIVTTVIATLIIAFMQARVLERHIRGASIGDWLLANVGATLITLTLPFIFHTLNDLHIGGTPGIAVVGIVNALVVGAVTGLAVVILLREYVLGLKAPSRIYTY